MQWSHERDMVVRRCGDGDRELVWLHGLGEQSASFDPCVHQLAGFKHVLPDLPGYGRSRWPQELPAGDSLAHLADHLAAWLRGRAPIIIGHSQGGVLAVLIAERIPLAGIVNVDGNLSRGDCSYSARAAATSLADFVAHGFAALLDDAYDRGGSEPAFRGYYAALRATCPEVFHRHATDLVAISESETLAARQAALRIPTLFLAGVPGGICARSRQLLDQHAVPWDALEPSGHWPFLDREAAFVAAVAGFCRRA